MVLIPPESVQIGASISSKVSQTQFCAPIDSDLPAAPIYQGAARLYEAIAADQASPKPDGVVARLAAFYSEAKK